MIIMIIMIIMEGSLCQRSLIPGQISLAHVKFKGVRDVKALQDLF